MATKVQVVRKLGRWGQEIPYGTLFDHKHQCYAFVEDGYRLLDGLCAVVGDGFHGEGIYLTNEKNYTLWDQGPMVDYRRPNWVQTFNDLIIKVLNGEVALPNPLPLWGWESN